MSDPFDLDPGAWARLRQLLDQALQQPAGMRGAWIDALPPEDATLASRLRNLLAHAPALQGTSIGGGDAVGDLAARLLQTLPKVETGQFAGRPPAPGPAEQVGPYRLLQELGHGGMASVWLAERTDVLQGRRAAIKLPLGAWHGAGLAERLARERAILATLNHPHIATLYDAGVDAAGRPWLALEYVEGERIDAHCARLGLGLPARLELFLQVVRAVAHAHGRLVVHRDLKPGNILVTADGQVKLLDFGIAKLLDEDLRADATELTRQAGRALTPDYAAPEQIAGQPLGTACDIYALGVVLYELLAGERPYRLQAGSRAALEQAILAVDPPPPSQRVADAAQARALRGDLDTIVRKAMKKSPAERYATAEALAEDIERHLRHEPVLARPDTRWYRVQRFVARHRVAVGAAAAVTVAVLGGAGAAVWQARQALAERDRAEEINRFMQAFFKDSDPYTSTGRRATLADMLQRALPRIERDFAQRPDTRIELLLLMGTALGNQQETAATAKALDEAVTLSRVTHGESHPTTLHARVARLGVYRLTGEPAKARAELKELLPALRMQPALAGDLAKALITNAHIAIDDASYAEAVATSGEARTLARTALGEADEIALDASVVNALALYYKSEFLAARDAAAQAVDLALRMRAGDTRHPLVINARAVYGRTLGGVGDFATAIEQYEHAITDGLVQFGPESFEVGFFQHNVAPLLVIAGRHSRALDLARASLAIFKARAEPGTHFVPMAQWRLGETLLAARRTPQALAVLEPALPELLKVVGPSHPLVRDTRLQLALAHAAQGRIDAARDVLAQAGLASAKPSSRVVRTQALVETMAGDPAAGERAATAFMQTLSGPRADVERMRMLPSLGRAQLALQRPADAQATFEQAGALQERLRVADSPERAEVWLGLGRAHLAQGRATQALPLLQRADAFWRGAEGADPRWSAEVAHWLARAQAMAAPGPRDKAPRSTTSGPQAPGRRRSRSAANSHERMPITSV